MFQTYYREFVRIDSNYTKFADGLVDYRVVANANSRKIYKPSIQVQVNESRARQVRAANTRMQDIPSVVDVEQAINGYISFTPTTHNQNHLQRGTIRIDRQTLYLQTIDSELPSELQPYAASINLFIIKIRETAVRRHLDYRQFDGHCYLKFLRIEWGIAVKAGKDAFQYDLSTEMLVTNVLPNPAPIAKEAQYHHRSLFENGTHYQHPYWKDANGVVATPAEEAIIAGLSDSE
ncbi:MAG: hypothetical protein ACRYFX_25415 [Janthinobacterium lividum]